MAETLRDPLAANFSGQDNAGGAAIFPKGPNDAARVLAAMIKERQLERRQQMAAEKDDLGNIGQQVGKAWERDQEYMLGRLRDYAKKAKQYHYGKGLTPSKKEELQLELIQEKGRLINDVNQSAANRARYLKMYDEMNKNPDLYDAQDFEGLKNFHDSPYESRDHEFSPDRGSEVSLLKYVQGLDIPTKVVTRKRKTADGKIESYTKTIIPAEDIERNAELELQSDNKNMRVYKKNYFAMHPNATAQDLKNDFIASMKSANKKFKDYEMEYETPAANDTTPKTVNDGAGVKVKDVVFGYEMNERGGTLTINKAGTDSDNRPLSFEKVYDAQGKQTDEAVDGVVRGVKFPAGGGDPYIEVVTKVPVYDPNKKGKKIGEKKEVVQVPGTDYNMSLLTGNYYLNPITVKRMLEANAATRWEARKRREGSTANRPAMTPDQRKIKGIASDNTVGKKPRSGGK